MQKKNILNLLSFSHYVADVVSLELKKGYKSIKNSFSRKSYDFRQIVSPLDLKIEKLVRKLILEKYPSHNIIGEEIEDKNKNSDYTWIIDPIDGTKAYLSGIPVFTFLLSLKFKEKFIFGLVEQPILKERFWNFNNIAYLNNNIIKTKKCKKLSEAIIAITEPEMFSSYANFNKNLFKNTSFIRWGTDALGYMRCAEGIIDGVVERNIKIWDIAAIEPIIKSAGGIISTWDGKKIGTNDTVCAAGDKNIHGVLVNTLQKLI